MNTRNTKQKELILDILHNNRTHPTIHEIYEYAKKKDSSIGQATIYRNINRLVEEKKVLKLPNSTNDSFHYDINTEQHIHFICNKCCRIIDIFDNDYKKYLKDIEKNHSLSINKTNIILEGLCDNCLDK